MEYMKLVHTESGWSKGQRGASLPTRGQRGTSLPTRSPNRIGTDDVWVHVGWKTVLVGLRSPVDRSFPDAIARAVGDAGSPTIERIVVDMREVPSLSDSVMALLLILHAKAGTARDQIYLINAAAEILQRLRDNGVSSLFHLDDARRCVRADA
jgi:hypothetical protein